MFELDSLHTQPFSVTTTAVGQKHLVLSPGLYPCHNGLPIYVICALLFNYDLYMLIYVMWGDAFGEGCFYTDIHSENKTMREAVASFVSTYVWIWRSPTATVAVNILKY